MELHEVMRLISLIPDGYRSFEVSAHNVTRMFGIGPELQKEMLAQGLPAKRIGEQWHFAWSDAYNISRYMMLPSPFRRGMLAWPKILERARAGATLDFDIQFRVDCPEPCHDGKCDFQISTPILDASFRMDENEDRLICGIEATSSANEEAIPDDVQSLLAKYDHIFLMSLPHLLTWPVEMVLETSIGDCISLAQLLEAEGRRLGYETRHANGIIMTAPFSTRHHWTEFKIGSTWVPFDPFLFKALHRWQVLESDEWSVGYPATAMLRPICGSSTRPLEVTHQGTVVPMTLPTRMKVLNDPRRLGSCE
ncbi:hypothetical protein GCM10022254_06340 [Actinomadura meridiana]|uniref:Transglutaminase-like domain-containing protein n=1 Tax=Actinomadura meridiana TaxID=559626 RepID=A0ABP8BSV0_9ACTN